MNNECVCNIVCVGDAESGKVEAVKTFINDGEQQQTNAQPTVGVEFSTKNVPVFDKHIKLRIWDTAGHERFSSVVSSYITKADIGIVIYDASSKTSFDYAIQVWCKQFKELNPTAQLLLVGNTKTTKSRTGYDEHVRLRDELGVIFLELNLNQIHDVNLLFNCCAKSYFMLKQVDIMNSLPKSN
jgi:small GTP-binding protein